MADPAGPTTLRVLLVEDDPTVRRFVSAQLESLEYTVTAVSSGVETLHQLSQDEHFDLLFTDVVMPGDVSGVELARRARRAFGADLKVLLTSGYPREALAAGDQPGPDMLLLRKPYYRHELERAVRQALVSRS